MILDNFNRTHNYLRISLTDQCNLRCNYCMPEKVYNFAPSHKLMQLHEIVKIVKIFVDLGVNKIRLTGGEPLARKDAPEIISELSKFPVELALTTNATKIHECIDIIKTSKLKSINASLDTLKKERFFKMTNRNQFDIVLRNIQILMECDLNLKINMVVIKNENDDEILDFIEFTKDKKTQIRFIEFMPFTGNHWNKKKLVTQQEILEIIQSKYSYFPLQNKLNDTSKNFGIKNHLNSFAIISTMSNPFCDTCNRIRLTADGKLKNCLFSKSETDILTPLRKNEDIVPLILQNIKSKHKELGGQFSKDFNIVDANNIENRSMITIGG